MGLAERAELTAELNLAGNFTRNLAGAERALGRFAGALDSPRIGRGISQIGTGLRNSALIATVGVGALATQVAAGLAQLVELESLGAQTNAVIKSTGGVAGVTAKQVRALAEEFESLNATIDDKVIQNTENLLLTFTSITKEGFKPTLEAVLDMNAALGGGEEGLQGVAIQVGKALQDPIRGLTALRRVGVNFTKDQEKQIKALVETGDVMGAQKLILAELNREFGGSFLAGGGTTAGKVAKFKDSIEDLQKALATALLPTVGKLADKLSGFLADPATVATVERLGDQIAGLFTDENISKGAGLVRDAFETIKSALPGLKDAASITGQVLSTAVGLFKSLPPDLQRLAIGALAVNKLTGGLVTNLAGGLLSLALGSLRTITAPHVTVIGGSVTGGAPGAVGGVSGGLASAVKIIGSVAIASVSIAALAEVFFSQRNGIAERTGEIGASVTNQITTGASTADLVKSQQALADGIAKLTSIPDFGILTGPAIADLRVQLDAVNAELRLRGADIKAVETAVGYQTQRQGETGAALKLAGDRAYDAIERNRAATSGVKASTDRSYDAIERLRAARQPITVNVSTSTTVTVRDSQIKARTLSRYGTGLGAQ